MLKSKELMIGNLVDFEATTHVIQSIDRWNATSYWLKETNEKGAELYKHPLSQIKPIPLTEEWLLKFGFIPLDGLNWCLGKIKVWSGATGIYHQFTTPDDIDDVLLKYVHQLQNLYFALRGEELTIEKHEIHS